MDAEADLTLLACPFNVHVQLAEMISLIRSGCIRIRTEVLTREVKKEGMSV